MPSKRFSLSSADGKKIVTGAIVAAGGVAVSVLVAAGAVWIHVISPELLPVAAVAAILAGVSAILLNAARKWLGQSPE